jgi:hypothetical protein
MSYEDHERSDSLKNLPTLEAIRAWLADDFSHRDEYNLVTAILRDRRVLLDDDEISLLIHKAREEGTPAAVTLDLLVHASEAEETSQPHSSTTSPAFSDGSAGVLS